MDLTHVHNTSDTYGGVWVLFVPLCRLISIPGGVKTGELVHTSQSEDGVW